jgi:hypothetical protein
MVLCPLVFTGIFRSLGRGGMPLALCPGASVGFSGRGSFFDDMIFADYRPSVNTSFILFSKDARMRLFQLLLEIEEAAGVTADPRGCGLRGMVRGRFRVTEVVGGERPVVGDDFI